MSDRWLSAVSMAPIETEIFKRAICNCKQSSLTLALFRAKNFLDKPREEAIKQEIIKRANEWREGQI